MLQGLLHDFAQIIKNLNLWDFALTLPVRIPLDVAQHSEMISPTIPI